jgi:hypothetical protein
MKPLIDYSRLRTFSDIIIAKEKLRYSILLQEDMLSRSFSDIRDNFILTLKQSVWDWATKVALEFLVTQINLRTSKRGK